MLAIGAHRAGRHRRPPAAVFFLAMAMNCIESKGCEPTIGCCRPGGPQLAYSGRDEERARATMTSGCRLDAAMIEPNAARAGVGVPP